MPSPASSSSEELIIGTYTERLPHVDGQAEGILSCRYDAGTIGPVRVLARTRNPSFLVVSPDGRRLYAVNETVEFEGQPGRFVIVASQDSNALIVMEFNEEAPRLRYLSSTPLPTPVCLRIA